MRFVLAISGLILIIIGVILVTVWKNPLPILVAICDVILIIIAFQFKKFLKNDEYVSDIFAAKKLRDTYFKENPSIIFENGFIEICEEFSKCNTEESSLGKFVNLLQTVIDYHPTKIQRIENIKNNVDLKK